MVMDSWDVVVTENESFVASFGLCAGHMTLVQFYAAWICCFETNATLGHAAAPHDAERVDFDALKQVALPPDDAARLKSASAVQITEIDTTKVVRCYSNRSRGRDAQTPHQNMNCAAAQAHVQS